MQVADFFFPVAKISSYNLSIVKKPSKKFMDPDPDPDVTQRVNHLTKSRQIPISVKIIMQIQIHHPKANRSSY